MKKLKVSTWLLLSAVFWSLTCVALALTVPFLFFGFCARYSEQCAAQIRQGGAK